VVDVRTLPIREEVKSLLYEPAVDLGDVVKGTAPTFVQDPLEFFNRTHFTDNMKTLAIKVLLSLLGIKSETVGGRKYEVSSNLILLPSDLGGGKTHSLILLYHLIKLLKETSSKEEVVSKLRVLDEDIAEFVYKQWDSLKKVSPNVVVIDCKYSDLAPSPVKPIEVAGRRIKTLWGYLGYELGRYDVVRNADERETAPYANEIQELLNGSKAVVLMDEIGRYYDQSGLEPSKISAFLMNLAEALSKYNIREVAVVISLPYEVRGRSVDIKRSMEYVHRPELVSAISSVLTRPNVEIIKPVGGRDLAEILRKRIFAYDKGKFERLASEFVAKELTREYPTQVRKVLEERGFWKAVKETYPFHPEFLNVLEKLAYRLPYLQRTRDAIKIAVNTVLALKEGLFKALDDEVALIMPYHIPIFVSEALDGTILRNAPSEYEVFRLILKSNVAIPDNFNNVRSYRKEEFYERIIVRELKSLKEEEMRLGVKLASIIWLHSLVGLGLPMNMGEYPTTADLIYTVSPTEQDVKGVLGYLRSLLPQLIVYGDPDSDGARWFFTSIPSVEELIEILKKNVTDEMVKDKLGELLEDGLTGKKGRGRPSRDFRTESIFSETAVVKTPASIPEEVLESRDPALVVFVDKVPKDDLLKVLKGRNNIVVLAPYVEGVDKEERLAPEDVKGIRELSSVGDGTLWDGLIEIARYYVATCNINEEYLKSFVSKELAKVEEQYLKDVMELLKSKVDNKKSYYYSHVWNLINKCYKKVYYHRLGAIRYETGLSLEKDKPIAPIVESFLKDKGLVPSEFKGENIISILRDYMGRDPTKEPINVGGLWQFILTTDKANVPFITYEMYLEAIKDLVKSLSYAIKIDEKIIWKPIFNSLEEAERSDEKEELLKQINDYLGEVGQSWDRLELIYWENIFERWLDSIIKSIPSNKALKVKDKSGKVLDVRDIKFDLKNTIKSGELFYETKKYPVELDVKLPEEMLERKEYIVEANLTVKNFNDEVFVLLRPEAELEVEPKELRGRSPLSVSLKVRAEKAGNYNIRVEVYDGKNLLDARIISIAVKGEWIEEEIEAKKPDDLMVEGVKVIVIRVVDLDGMLNMIRVAKTYPGTVSGELVLESKSCKLDLKVEKAEDPKIIEMLWSSVSNLMRTLSEVRGSVNITYVPKDELELRDIAKLILDAKGLKFEVKKKAR